MSETVEAATTGYAPGLKVGRSEQSKYEELWGGEDYRAYSPGEQYASAFLQIAKPKRGAEVIDFGCGSGRGGLMLYAMGGMKPLFVDFADNALDPDIKEACKTFPDKWKFYQHDLTKFPMPVQARYGYCADVMEHIPPEDVPVVLKNILRTARNVFFAISTVDDHFGQTIGESLHLTVKPYSWWLAQFQSLHCNVFWSQEAEEGCAFYVSAFANGEDLLDAMKLNVDDRVVYDNVLANLRGGYTELVPHDTQDTEIMILGGGPSLADFEDEIRARREAGMPMVTTNGTYNWAIERGLRPSAQVMIDAREFNRRFVDPPIPGCKYLIGSQCHPSVAAGLPKEQVLLWHGGSTPMVREAIDAHAKESGKEREWYPIYGGSSVMLRAIPLLRTLGFRKFHIYGMDSCIRNDQHHAYEQPENDGVSVVEVQVGGRKFRAEPWMWCQAEEFIKLTHMISDVCELEVYGDGLIAHIIKTGAEMSAEESETSTLN